jgi:hypothetical protein
MTVLERLSVLSRTLDTDAENFNFINTACSFFSTNLPKVFGEDFYIEEEVTDSGLSCGLNYSSVIRDGIPCRRVPANLKRRLENADSEYAVDKDDPVFYKENTKLFIKPDPTAQEQGFVLKAPDSFIPSGANENLETIPNIPKESEDIILLYAGFLITSKKVRDLAFPPMPVFDDVANTFNISFPVIGDITVDTTLDFTSLDAISYTDIDDSDYTIDLIDINKGLEALNNAFKFIGQLTEEEEEGTPTGEFTPTDVPTGAFWLDDEDPEMVQSATQLAAQEVNRANSYFGNRATGLNSFRTIVDGKVAEFSAKVQVEVSKLNARIQQMQTEAQAKRLLLEKHGLSIQEVNTELQKFQIDVTQRLQGNQQLLERFSQSLQSYQLEYSTLSQEAVSLFERFRVEFANYLGINQNESQ